MSRNNEGLSHLFSTPGRELLPAGCALFWRSRKSLGLLVLLLAGVHLQCSAAFRPTFRLDHSAWQATDVYLVSTTPEDGVFEVVESWKGDLLPGSSIWIPELVPMPGAKPILAGAGVTFDWMAIDFDEARRIPRQPTGSRIILFLKRKAPDSKAGWSASNDFEDYKTSAAWVVEGRVYGFRQVINPGPSVIVMLRESESQFKDRVAEVVRVQKELQESADADSIEVKLNRLKSHLQSDIYFARKYVLEALGRLGPSATGAIRGMLDDPRFAADVIDLLDPYVEDGGEWVGMDLNDRLRKQLLFWTGIAPSLPEGWWEDQNAQRRKTLREQYSQTFALLRALQKLHVTEAVQTSRQLADLWRSYSQLNDQSGVDRIIEECDQVIQNSSRQM